MLSGPLARLRSPRPLNMDVGRTRRHTEAKAEYAHISHDSKPVGPCVDTHGPNVRVLGLLTGGMLVIGVSIVSFGRASHQATSSMVAAHSHLLGRLMIPQESGVS